MILSSILFIVFYYLTLSIPLSVNGEGDKRGERFFIPSL